MEVLTAPSTWARGLTKGEFVEAMQQEEMDESDWELLTPIMVESGLCLDGDRWRLAFPIEERLYRALRRALPARRWTEHDIFVKLGLSSSDAQDKAVWNRVRARVAGDPDHFEVSGTPPNEVYAARITDSWDARNAVVNALADEGRPMRKGAILAKTGVIESQWDTFSQGFYSPQSEVRLEGKSYRYVGGAGVR